MEKQNDNVKKIKYKDLILINKLKSFWQSVKGFHSVFPLMLDPNIASDGETLNGVFLCVEGHLK